MHLKPMGLVMEWSVDDLAPFLEAVSDFAQFPGVPTDALVKQFLKCFPLSEIIRTLESKPEVAGLEATLVACLDKVFQSTYGASLIPNHMAFLEMGLQDDSQLVKCLCCRTVTCLLQHLHQNNLAPARLVTENDLYPLLLNCLVDGDSQMVTASTKAIKNLASTPQGMAIVFPKNSDDATHLGQLASQCSPQGRVRILILIVKLFSISHSVASVICNSNLLTLLVEELENSRNSRVTLNVLDLLCQLTENDHGTEFVSRTDILQLLTSIISNTLEYPSLRSRALMISGRLLSRESIYSYFDESGIKAIISAIDGVLGYEIENVDECEAALEALGQIGLVTQGAILTLTSNPPAARHVIDAAFNQGHGKQIMTVQAALHALANISGQTRPENSKLLNSKAEESLQALVYETASKSSKLTPSGLVLSVLQQTAEVRLACYRVVSGMVVRPWFLTEVCSKPEIINILTGGGTRETTKTAKNLRYNSCKETYIAFMSSTKLADDPACAAISSTLQNAVSRGPYRALRKREIQPVAKTAKRNREVQPFDKTAKRI